MTPKFYIKKEDKFGETYRHYFTPEPVEIKCALASIKWGMTKGIVSLITPIRNTTTYWEI